MQTVQTTLVGCPIIFVSTPLQPQQPLPGNGGQRSGPMHPLNTFLPLVMVAATNAAAVAVPLSITTTPFFTQLPLVIWHGLGDSTGNAGLQRLAALAADINPGTYVHLVHLGSTPDDVDGDQQASFFGNMTNHIATVCAQFANDPVLTTAPAINSLGISQGGLFLRAYVERCAGRAIGGAGTNYDSVLGDDDQSDSPPLSRAPPVHTLVTLGSPHSGIAAFQRCPRSGGGAAGWRCRGAERLLRLGRWSAAAQGNPGVIPAQYFRDPTDLELYLEHSNFLADVNNERAEKNAGYAARLGSLGRLVLYMFEADEMVVPKESAVFGERLPDEDRDGHPDHDPIDDEEGGRLVPLREREMYTGDWLGLRALDERDRLEMVALPGAHLEMSDMEQYEMLLQYFGPVNEEELEELQRVYKNADTAGEMLVVQE